MSKATDGSKKVRSGFHWKDLKIGKKIGIGFGVVLLLLVGVGLLAILGLGSVITDAEEVIYGNELNAEMIQKEVDHLHWVGKVNTLLTDKEVTKLEIETDDHQCSFGKWLYSDSRKEAEAMIPGLAAVLKNIEEPHRHLHESAIHIDEVFVQADAELPGILATPQVDHLKWAEKIRDCFLTNSDSLKVQTDPTQCGLGKWLNSDQAKAAYASGTAEFKKTWDEMVESHSKLHKTAIEISSKYVQVHTGLRQLLLRRLLDHKNWAEKVSEAIIEGKSDLGVQTDPHKCTFGKFLTSQECKNYMEGFPELEQALEAAKEPHKHLHESAVMISDRKSTRLNSSHTDISRMPSSA